MVNILNFAYTSIHSFKATYDIMLKDFPYYLNIPKLPTQIDQYFMVSTL